MLRFYIIILICLPLFSFAQSDRDTRNHPKMLLATFSPGVTYRTLNYGSGEEWIGELRNNTETPKFAFNATLFFGIPLGSRFNVRTGLQFSNKGHRTKKQTLQWMEGKADFPTTSRTRTSYHSLGIPLEVHFTALQKKDVSLNPFLGIVPEIVINMTTVVKNYRDEEMLIKSHSRKSVGYAKFGLNARAGVQLMYSLSERNCLTMGVMLEYALTSRLVSSNAAERNYGAYTTFGFARKF